MIRLAAYLTEFYIIVARNSSEKLVYMGFDVRIGEYTLTIFGTPDEVVPEVVSCMGCALDGHAFMLAWELFRTIADAPSDSPMPEHWGLSGGCQLPRPYGRGLKIRTQAKLVRHPPYLASLYIF